MKLFWNHAHDHGCLHGDDGAPVALCSGRVLRSSGFLPSDVPAEGATFEGSISAPSNLVESVTSLDGRGDHPTLTRTFVVEWYDKDKERGRVRPVDAMCSACAVHIDRTVLADIGVTGLHAGVCFDARVRITANDGFRIVSILRIDRDPAARIATEHEGFVVRFDPKTGFGFLRTDREDIYFSRRTLLESLGLSTILVGSSLRYASRSGNKGLEAVFLSVMK